MSPPSHCRPGRMPPSPAPAGTSYVLPTQIHCRPFSITSNFTSRAFSVSTPSTWNSLPAHIRSLDKLSTFKRQLKSHLFQSAFAVYI